jgi:hypothetical protein
MIFYDIVRELEGEASATQSRLQEATKRIQTERRSSKADNQIMPKYLNMAYGGM